MTWVLPLVDERATIALGNAIAQVMEQGGTVFLNGTLGAGKTTLTRGILAGFSYSGPVKSPTYTLVEPYELPQITVYHFDLYRLGDPEELEYMGIRDYFSDSHLCVVEWPERGRGFLPTADIEIQLQVAGPGRQAQLQGNNNKGAIAVAEIGKRLG